MCCWKLNKTIDQSINQSINQLINQLIHLENLRRYLFFFHSNPNTLESRLNIKWTEVWLCCNKLSVNVKETTYVILKPWQKKCNQLLYAPWWPTLNKSKRLYIVSWHKPMFLNFLMCILTSTFISFILQLRNFRHLSNQQIMHWFMAIAPE